MVGVLVVWRAVFMAGFTLSTPSPAGVSSAGGRVVVRGPVRAVAGDKKGGAAGRAPPFLVVWAAVSYSPTPWRVQYHRRWQS